MTRSRINLVGQKFGKRVVLAFIGPDKWGTSKWQVRCDCGSILETTSKCLRDSICCKSCHPAIRTKRPFEAQYNAWTALVGNKGKRKIEITFEEYANLAETTPDCHYCGDKIKWIAVSGGPENNRLGASYLDRKDSDGDYTLDNVVVCCSRCNMSKGNRFTYNEWKEIGALIRSWKVEGDLTHVVAGQAASNNRNRDFIAHAQDGYDKQQSHSRVPKTEGTLVQPPRAYPRGGCTCHHCTNWNRGKHKSPGG
jgi:hypothetical protein